MTIDTIACPSCGSANLPGSKFCSTCATLIEPPAPVAETRKTVTILFCDAVSSTALGERLDPESLRAVMTRYFDAMRAVIEVHGGVVEKFIGDAVMAVFGVPTVHEDDALRACRAAAQIRERLAKLDVAIRADLGATVEWRMGINTGEVVAGEASGQRMVTGDAVNVAARLEAAAAPGEILIGPETHALVRGAVVADAIEPLALKGKSQPIPAWRLESVQDQSARQPRPLEAALVGRSRPLRLLHDAFREATDERVCHLFTVLGVAGVGKSRLVDEFTGSLADQARVATGRCLAYGQGITYWPVIEAIRDGAGISESDTAETARDRLHVLLAGEPEEERVVSLVGSLLGIGDSAPAADELFWAIRRTFEAMARQRPLVLVFDDIHWGQPTFLDLVDHIADWTRDAPILLIAMARPELLEQRPAWGGGKRSATTIQLEPLSDLESEELVTSLLGRADLPAEFRNQISHAAEGNPLFVEELLGKLIDDGFLVQAGGGWAASGDLGQLAIPPTIQALLAARLDGLGSEERTVIERASVEGKVFHRGAVTEMAPESMRSHVRERLANLMRMELVRPDQASFAGEEAYRFRHLLIRDAAYQALAKQTRSELHEQFAGWLERAAGDLMTEYQQIIGYHLEQAYRYRVELGPADAHADELAARAAELLLLAGDRALARWDAHATVDLLSRAIDLLPPDSPRRWSATVDLADSLFKSGQGRRSEILLPEVIEAATGAGKGAIAARAELMLLEIQGSHESLEAADVVARATPLREVLLREGDAKGAFEAGILIAMNRFFAGRGGQAIAELKLLIENAQASGLAYSEAEWWLSAVCYWGPTPVAEAVDLIEGLMRRSPGSAVTFNFKRLLGGLRGKEGRFEEGRQLIAESKRVAQELGLTGVAESVDGHFAGPLEYLAGNGEVAVELMEGSYRRMTASGDRSFASTVAAWLATALLDLERDAEAWHWATIARETSAEDDMASQVEGRRTQARVLARRGDVLAAETLAREAVAMVDATDYYGTCGDVHTDLAHVLRAAGKDAEALDEARQGLAFYERKGVIPLADRARKLIAAWTGG